MNIVLITDTNGDTVDVNCYCSDTCAQTDPLYEGWFGCVEAAYDTACRACETAIIAPPARWATAPRYASRRDERKHNERRRGL